MMSNDVDRAMSLWDQEYPRPVFQAPDFSSALLDRTKIREFYNEQAAVMEKSDWAIDETVVDVLGVTAYVHCTVDIKADIKGIDHPMTFRDHDTFVLRRNAGQWKIVLYHESLSRDVPKETRELRIGP